MEKQSLSTLLRPTLMSLKLKDKTKQNKQNKTKQNTNVALGTRCSDYMIVSSGN